MGDIFFRLCCMLGLKRGEVRPWGIFEQLEQGPGYQVKRIEVRPGKRLSLQSHRHRYENWVVAYGVATVECDGKLLELEAGQHIHIPLGARHRLANQTQSALVIIEVQHGDYLGEDDIIRYEDDFNRLKKGPEKRP